MSIDRAVVILKGWYAGEDLNEYDFPYGKEVNTPEDEEFFEDHFFTGDCWSGKNLFFGSVLDWTEFDNLDGFEEINEHSFDFVKEKPSDWDKVLEIAQKLGFTDPPKIYVIFHIF